MASRLHYRLARLRLLPAMRKLHDVTADKAVVSLLTLPRSGTWYSHYFFEYLAGENNPSPLRIYHGLPLVKYQHHMVCPGYMERAEERWHALGHYYWAKDAYDSYDLLKTYRDLFFPEYGRGKVAYLYRNPLDHMVSYYDHALHRYYGSLAEYALGDGVNVFIKMLYSYERMRELFPERILILRYEDLIVRPHEGFASLLEFYGLAVNEERLEQALARSTLSSLQALERQSNRCLSDGEVGKSHFHGGEVGKWKTRFTGEELAAIEKKLSAFGYSLEEFPI